MKLSTRLVLALLVLLATVVVPPTLADPTPTVRKWREFVYGKVRYDGVEYFDFDVPEHAYRVFVTFDRSELRDMAAPTLFIKYGAFPSTSDFDQQLFLNETTSYYSAQVDNLRVGRYFVLIAGSRLYDSLMAFVGSYQPLFYFINVVYFGCSDPTRIGSKCNIPVLPTDPLATPTTQSVAKYYQSDSTNKGCLDSANPVLYYTLDQPSAEWDLTLTLTTSSPFDMTIATGANLRDPATLKADVFAQRVTAKGGDSERSVDLRVLAPLSGPWMVMVSGAVPSGSSCQDNTGVTFQFVAKNTRDCSKVDGAMIAGDDAAKLSPLDLCSVSFRPLNEIRYNPFKDGVVLDTDFEADEPIVGNGGSDTRARAASGYIANVPKTYAGANLVVEALVTANVKSFQVYARVGGYPTPSQFDYHFNSSNTSEATRANNKSSDWSSEVLQYKWAPIVFPKTGLWHMLVVADSALTLPPGQSANSNSSFWATDLSLHTYACPKDAACSGHGDCELTETYRGLHYGACSCHYGFGGEQCDTLTVESSFRSHQIFLLIFSNAAILPVTLLCCKRKLYLESVLFFLTGLTSAVYHACDVELKCLFPYKFLQQMDFALSFNMIMLICVHFSGARKQAKAGIQVLLLVLTVVLATNDATAMANWVLIGAFCALQFSVTLVYYFVLGSQRMGLGRMTALRAFLFHSDNFEPRFGIIGLVLWISALSCWFTSSPTNYWIIHSIWHIGAMIAAFCLIGFRRNDRYQMLAPVTGVDVLGPNYTATQPTVGLKNMAKSKAVAIPSERETSDADVTGGEEA